MRRHMPLLSLFLIFLFLLSGCDTFYKLPNKYELSTTMYFTSLSGQPKILKQYEAKVSCEITDYRSDQVSIDIYIEFPEDAGLSFIDDSCSFTIHKEDLPYYCAKGELFSKSTDSLFDYWLAVDPQHDYLIFMTPGSSGCLVASTDPNLDPLLIRRHFSDFRNFCDKLVQ